MEAVKIAVVVLQVVAFICLAWNQRSLNRLGREIEEARRRLPGASRGNDGDK